MKVDWDMVQKKDLNMYILLTYTGSMLSSLIRRLSEYPYSHIAIGLDPSFQTFYSFGRKYFSNPLIAGFVSEDVKDGVYTRFANTEFCLYKVKIDEEQYNQIQDIIYEFECNKKCYRYNFIGLVTAKAGFSFERQKAYFCSEFASEVVERASIYKFEKPRGMLHPMDFLDIPDIQLVAEGKLSEFRKETWDITTPDLRWRTKIPLLAKASGFYENFRK